MLYLLHDVQHALLAPAHTAAEMTRTAFLHPSSAASHSSLGRAVGASAELLSRGTRRYGKTSFDLERTTVDGTSVAVTPHVVEARPFGDLLHFARALETPRPQDPRVLVVAPLAGHHATLLRGTVEGLLPNHDVFITDWRDARLVPLADGTFGLDDYVDYLLGFLRFLGPGTHVLAVCQPTVPVLVATSLLAAHQDPVQPLSLVLMGGPVDVRAAPTAVTEFADRHPLEWFERTVVQVVPPWHPGRFRRVYPGFLQLSGFMAMNPQRHVDQHVKLFQDLVRGHEEDAEQTRRFYDEYLSVLDLDAAFYLETVDRVFQRALLPRGEMTWRGVPVRPEVITRPGLMTVEGELDDVAAPGQTLAAHALCKRIPEARRRHHLQPGAGHYGIFSGRRWREEVLPRVTAFFREMDAG